MSREFHNGQILIATRTITSFQGSEIVEGNLYIAGHSSNFAGPEICIVNEQGVSSRYPNEAFERANIHHMLGAAT